MRKEAGHLHLRWGLVLAVLSFQGGCAPSTDGRETGIGNPELARADSLVEAWVREGRIPGAVLLVAEHGEVLLQRAYGSRERLRLAPDRARAGESVDPYSVSPTPLQDPPPMTPGTTFDLASVTKVMATTMAFMRLVDQGLLQLDAPAWRYLSGFRGAHKDSIEVRHLLTHSAGLAQWQPLYYTAASPEEAFRVIRDMPLTWGVGEGRHYSDLGFMLLGRVVESVTGLTLDRFVSQEIYGPLRLEHTGFRPVGCDPHCPGGPFAATSHGNPYEYRMVHDTAFGYRYGGDPDTWNGWRRYTLVGEVNDGNAFHAFGGVAGHAGLFSTAEDLQVLLDLLLNGGVSGERQLMAEETVRTFLTPTEFGQALGWQTPDWAPEGSFSHTGFTGTFVMGVPSRGLALILLTNRQNMGVDSDTRYPDLGPLQRGVVEAVTASEGPLTE